MIDTIIFDLDETLMYEQRSVDATFRAVCGLAHAKYGVDVDALHESVLARSREIWWNAPVRPYTKAVGVSTWEGLSGPFSAEVRGERELVEYAPGYRIRGWRNGLADHGIEDEALVEEMAGAFQTERQKHHVLFDDTLPVLERLQGRYRIGMLTNGAPSVQSAKIEATGLAPYFDVIVVTGAVGVAKPHPRPFEHALGLLGADKAETVMIGDSLKKDIAGAQQLGMTAVWMNPDGKEPEDGVVPDHEVRSLTEFEALLERL
jgi:putative hydrolase of the HAD superfamily